MNQPPNFESLNNFISDKQREILAFAQKNTEEVVKTEMALLDFELLLAVSPNESTIDSRELRTRSWDDLSAKFNGDYNKMMGFIEGF